MEESQVSLLDSVSIRYGCRPSEVIGIEDKYIAYVFDVTICLAASKLAEGKHYVQEIAKKERRKDFQELKEMMGRVQSMKD